MEEYKPNKKRGNIVYAGGENAEIIEAAENDPDGCDGIIWDGGNNDFPFYQSDLAITVLDPHRPGHELNYYPGEVSLRNTDVAIINKIDSADSTSIQMVENNVRTVNSDAALIKAKSPITVDQP